MKQLAQLDELEAEEEQELGYMARMAGRVVGGHRCVSRISIVVRKVA